MKWFTILLFFCSCASMKTPLSSQSVSIHDIYVLVSVQGESVRGKLKNQSTLEINLTDMTMMGNDGCNDFSGKINHHNASKNQINFSDIIATEMYCNELSNQVGNSFRKVKKYKRDEMILTLLSHKDEELLSYKKVD